MVGWGRIRDVLIGIAGLLIIESVWIYGIGFSVQVPKSEVAALSQTLATELNRRWPEIQGPLMRNMRPLVKAQVNRIVSTITVNIGGVPIQLPPDLRTPVARELTVVLQGNLEQYFSRKFRPSQLISPALVGQLLRHPMQVNMWVDVWRIPVPIRVQVP